MNIYKRIQEAKKEIRHFRNSMRYYNTFSAIKKIKGFWVENLSPVILEIKGEVQKGTPIREANAKGAMPEAQKEYILPELGLAVVVTRDDDKLLTEISAVRELKVSDPNLQQIVRENKGLKLPEHLSPKSYNDFRAIERKRKDLEEVVRVLLKKSSEEANRLKEDYQNTKDRAERKRIFNKIKSITEESIKMMNQATEAISKRR